MMTIDLMIAIIILLIAIILFVTEKLRADLVALCAIIALVSTGILTIEEGIAGFSSSSVLSIAFLFVVGGAVFQTGLAATITNYIVKIGGDSEARLLMLLMISVATMSAFISSTGVVALMLPVVINLAKRTKVPASKLLMPMAFGALLGGTTTLIATPPNIIVSETLETAGYEPFTFFSFTIPGSLLLIAGLIYILVFGRKLIPHRKSDHIVQRMETPGELFELYKLPDNMYHLRVHEQSMLAGLTIGQSHLRSEFNVTIINIQRTVKKGASLRELTIQQPNPETVIQPDDILIVQADISDLTYTAGYWNLGIMTNHPIRDDEVITNEVGIAEVILRPRSTLIEKTLPEVRFGTVYNLTVLSIRRPGADEVLNLKETPLKFGDMLLVQGRWKHIFALKQLRQDFIVMGESEAAEAGAFTRSSHAPITLMIMIGMVVVLALNIMSLTLASLIAAVLIVLTGCLSMDEAYESIDWKSLVVIAGMIPMSTALQKVGLVDIVADFLMNTLGDSGPIYVLAGLFLITVILTQLVSNTATALLIAPVAITAAIGLNVAPQAFMMAVAIGASMAFISPVSTPVTMLVMGAGNYRFSDFGKVGAPLILIAFLVVIFVLPILWPF